VIEHLFSPREFLQAVRNLLVPGGMVVLTCPNGRGFDIQTLGPVSESVDHEHLNYFSPQSLTQLLVSCGFEVIDADYARAARRRVGTQEGFVRRL
jgi:2-polyprenyl-3-methyl-5-hydroxy-6-metoxy-1,4-benzoquinol methylase